MKGDITGRLEVGSIPIGCTPMGPSNKSIGIGNVSIKSLVRQLEMRNSWTFKGQLFKVVHLRRARSEFVYLNASQLIFSLGRGYSKPTKVVEAKAIRARYMYKFHEQGLN
ncbi:hypothetical protein Fot_04693 [Forsythia ovata]|uniref:Uncharacterized protein n=1 Tax=Forsythia ovata TaxID=205694 RepID=A0ABD1XDE5_9LAMI